MARDMGMALAREVVAREAAVMAPEAMAREVVEVGVATVGDGVTALH